MVIISKCLVYIHILYTYIYTVIQKVLMYKGAMSGKSLRSPISETTF